LMEWKPSLTKVGGGFSFSEPMLSMITHCFLFSTGTR
jgi:hypothetical protein